MDLKELKGLAGKYMPAIKSDFSQKVKNIESFAKFDILEVKRKDKPCHQITFKPGLIGKTYYAYIDPETGQIIERNY